jgi:membrane carboxypeptidase/penicillin-binding protein PbpC
LRIENPAPGALYLRDPTLRDDYQALPLRAVVEGRSRLLTWSVDGRVVGSVPSDRPLRWPLAPGEHTIEVSDGQLADATTIVVR